ncbi:MAG: hypothetical protein U1E76_22175 [Planctomycetota bacterium]
MRIVQVTGANRAALGPRIQALEANAVYPLGRDSFRIDHGQDYFAFFERLGALRYFVALEDGQVMAVAAAVLRRVPRLDGSSCRAWYLCDLKARPDARGRSMSILLLRHGFLRLVWRCRRAYAISMNPGDGSPNPVARLLARFRWAPLRIAKELALFTVAPAQLAELRPTLERHRGAWSLVSLRGKKDLVLASTGAPMALLHLQFGAPPVDPAERVRLAQAPADAACMFCAPADDALVRELRTSAIEPMARATILAHRLEQADWRFVRTSEI